MLKKLLLLVALLAPLPAIAQSVQQSGSVTRNQVPVWVTSGVIGGSQSAPSSSADSVISSLGVTNNGGAGFCVNSGRAASTAYQALCFGANTTGPATITLQNFGSAPAETLNFIINGVTFPFPGALASITIASTPVIGGTNGDCLTISSAIVNQVPCTILSAGTTGTGPVVLQNSPTLAGTIGGNLTFSGNELFSGNVSMGSQLIVNGVSTPASATNQTVIMGSISAPVLGNTGQAWLFNTAVGGANLQGDGSSQDITLLNKSGTPVMQVTTGTTGIVFPGVLTLSGLASGTCANSVLLNSSNQTILGSCPGAASSIQVGSTAVTSGTANNILFNNAGTLGNETIASILTAGTGISITGTTNATIALVTPVATANGGTGVSSPTAHALLAGEGSSAFASIGPGTLGQGLVSGGGSADPSYISGTWSLLAALTASGSATLNDTSHLTSSYNDYKLVLENLVCSSNNQTVELQVHVNGAFQTSSYITGTLATGNGATSVTNATTFIQLSQASGVQNTGQGLSGEVMFYTPSGTTAPKTVNAKSGHFGGTVFSSVVSSGMYNGGNQAIDGFQVLCSTGNIATGTIKIYGML
jgi:hypothetical protein